MVLALVAATFARPWRIPASSLPVVVGIVVAWPASCAAT